MMAEEVGFNHGFLFGDELPGPRLDHTIAADDLAMLHDEALAAAG